MPAWLKHLKDWSGVISLVGLLLFGMRALGFASQSTGTRLDMLERRAADFEQFMQQQKALNVSLQIYMCAGDYDSAVLAGVRCRDLGIDRMESRK